MNENNVSFYEELKKLRSASDALNKISNRIKHAEEALTKNANKLPMDIKIGPNEYLSWAVDPRMKKERYRILYIGPNGESDTRPFGETPIEIRLKHHDKVIELVRAVNESLRDMLVGFDIEDDNELDNHEQ